MTYKIGPAVGGRPVTCIIRDATVSIPLDMGNRDTVAFVNAWKNGTEPVVNQDDTTAPYSDAACEALGLTPPS